MANNFSDLSGPAGFLSGNRKDKFLRDLPNNLRKMGISSNGNSRSRAEEIEEELFDQKGLTRSQFEKKIKDSSLSSVEKQKMISYFLDEREEN